MAMKVPRRRFGGLRVVIAGGGVAGLETMLALSMLAGGRTEIELLSAEHELWYRPLATAEPFGAGVVRRLEVGALAADVGASFTPGALAAVDPERHCVTTTRGLELPYDVLVLACGAVPRPAVPGALTFRGPADADVFRRLLDEVERGPASGIAFVQPPGTTWPLPLYELALETSAHLEMCGAAHVDLAVVTSERAPLALFGRAASEAVRSLLRERAIALRTDAEPDAPPDARVVALPRLEGQPLVGVPQDAHGFVATDESGRVRGLSDVFAAGDITTFPVKQGGIAAQQADAAAEAIAVLAGADLVARPFRPVLRALLLTGQEPLYVYADLAGDGEWSSTVSRAPLWKPAGKIVARHLAPFLARHGDVGALISTSSATR